MHTALITAEVVLALVFLFSGLSKAFLPIPTLVRKGQTGVADMPVPLVRFVGISELLGVLGLFAPGLTGHERALTPLAAVGFGMIMLLAAGVHLQRREYRTVLGNAVLFALAAFVAVGGFLGH